MFVPVCEGRTVQRGRCTSVPRPHGGNRAPRMEGRRAGEASGAGAQGGGKAGVLGRGLDDDAPRQLVERHPGPGGSRSPASTSAGQRGGAQLVAGPVRRRRVAGREAQQRAARPRSPWAASISAKHRDAASSDSGRPIASASSSESRSAGARGAAGRPWRRAICTIGVHPAASLARLPGASAAPARSAAGRARHRARPSFTHLGQVGEDIARACPRGHGGRTGPGFAQDSTARSAYSPRSLCSVAEVVEAQRLAGDVTERRCCTSDSADMRNASSKRPIAFSTSARLSSIAAALCGSPSPAPAPAPGGSSGAHRRAGRGAGCSRPAP